MAAFRRGVRNTFRNVIRSVSITAILALTVALAMVMLLSMKAVEGRINDVKGEIGTRITVSPAGSRGFAGGGNPLSAEDISKIQSTSHVEATALSLTDQVRTEGATAFAPPGGSANADATTNLVSSIDAGALGRRFRGGTGTGTGTGGQGSATAPGGTGAEGGTSPQGGTNSDTISLPITVTGTSDPTSTLVSGVSTFTITAGDVIDGAGATDTALLGKDLAAKNNLSTGSTFTAYGHTITVDGIFDTGNTFTNGGFIVPLATLQTLTGQTGAVTGVLVKVDSVGNVASTTTALQTSLGSTADVVSDATNSESTISSLNNVKTISTYSLIGALVAGAAILFLSMLMIVRERRREIGVLKAIGASNSRISFQFISEALTLTMMAAVVGVLVGIVLSNPVLDVLVTNSSSNTSAAAAAVAPGAGGRAQAAGTGAFGGPAAAQAGSGGGNGTATNAGGGAAGDGSGRRFGAAGIGRGVTQFSGALDNVRASIGLSVLLYGLLAALAIAIAGSAVPSYLIAKVRPAEVMRSD